MLNRSSLNKVLPSASGFLMTLLATSTILIPLGLNQNQIAIGQQQKLQGFQNNQTSSSLTKQQQPTGISFQIDNMTFSHHTASVNGIQLHYVIGGHGDPVVLLHGWPETWYEWHHVIPALATNYTVITPDLRGLGDSSKPLTGYDGKSVAEDIHQLVTQLGFKNNFPSRPRCGVTASLFLCSCTSYRSTEVSNYGISLPWFYSSST